jgi:hypothetical protein
MLVLLVCKMVRYCSVACESSTPSHQIICIPSVTPKESKSIFEHDQCSQGHQDYMFHLINSSPHIKSTPAPISSKTFYISPDNFISLRVRKDPSKLVSFSFDQSADVRFTVGGAITARIDGESGVRWATPRECSDFYLDQGVDDYVLVAPGIEMLTNMIARRSLPKGVERRSLEFPDEELIEYEQTLEQEEGAKLVLGFIMIEWQL